MLERTQLQKATRWLTSAPSGGPHFAEAGEAIAFFLGAAESGQQRFGEVSGFTNILGEIVELHGLWLIAAVTRNPTLEGLRLNPVAPSSQGQFAGVNVRKMQTGTAGAESPDSHCSESKGRNISAAAYAMLSLRRLCKIPYFTVAHSR